MASSTRQRSRTFGEAEADEERARLAPSTPAVGELSATELRHEMETLLSLRRRSLSQPAALDPDLPEPSPAPASTRPTLTIHTAALPLAPSLKSPTAAGAAETGTLVRRPSSLQPARLPSDHPLPTALASLPSPPLASPYSPPHDGAAAAHSSQDLFWLPASLHPELAPQEFKAFIREQTRPDNLARRVSSAGERTSSGFGSGRIDRKKSMLRGEYTPAKGDGVGETGASGKQSAGTEGRTAGRLNFEELTIKDLQRLEVLAARAEAEGFTESDEGERLGRVLRRSLSLNPNHVAAAAAEGAHLTSTFAHDSFSPSTDGEPLSPDSPLIVPPPGQILRRSARTKIRKAGLVGDGGGHRFGPSRRGRTSQTGSLGEERTHSDAAGDSDRDSAGEVSFEGLDSLSLDGHSAVLTQDPSEAAFETGMDARPAQRLSSSTEGSHELHFSPAIDIEHIEEVLPEQLPLVVPLPPSPVSPLPILTAEAPVPVRATAEHDWLTHGPPQQPSTSVLPLPFVSIATPQTAPPLLVIPSPPASFVRPPVLRDAKEKKSGWARLGLSSRSTPDEDEPKKKRGKVKETEKLLEVIDTSRRSQPTSAPDHPQDRRTSNSSEKEKESSFFGGLFSKRRPDAEQPNSPSSSTSPPSAALSVALSPPPPTASGVMGPGGRYTNFYRLPIHVERAVYRLSHIKLANPRRPLYEQVLISNLMFWYLAVINKPTMVPLVAAVPIPTRDRNGQISSGEEPAERSAAGAKRPGLTKGPPTGRQPGRSAEQPVRQPKYEEQTRQIDQEYQPLPSHSQPAHEHAPQQSHHHTRSASTPQAVTNGAGPPPTRSPDRTSAPADLYRPASPTRDTRPRAPSPQLEDQRKGRPAPTAARENLGFQVISRDGRPKGWPEGPPAQQNGYGPRPDSLRRSSSGSAFDEVLSAYLDSSPSTSPVLEERSDWSNVDVKQAPRREG